MNQRASGEIHIFDPAYGGGTRRGLLLDFGRCISFMKDKLTSF